MLWLLRSSPLDVKTLFWSKYLVGTVPLLVISLPLIVITDLILDVSPFILSLTTLAMFGMTFALTALALGFGALFPSFETDNAAEIPTSFGGLMFMMSAVLYLGAIVVLLAWPAYLYLSAGLTSPGGGGVGPTGPLVFGVSGAIGITVLAVLLPLRAGVRKVRQVEL